MKPLVQLASSCLLAVSVMAEVPSAITDAVSESGDYELIYQVALPAVNEWSGDAANIAYSVDNSGGAIGPRGKFGGNLRLNGEETFVPVPNTDSLNLGTEAVSLAMWVRLDDLPVELTEGFAGIFDSTQDGYILYLDQNNNELRFKVTAEFGAERPGIPAADLVTGQWLHVAGVYQSGEAKIYLNGVEKDSHAGPTGTVNSGQEATFGRNGTEQLSFFRGGLDDAAIWNRALTEAEVLEVMNGGLVDETPGLKNGLVSYWPMNDGEANPSTSVVSDLEGNNTLELSSATGAWESPAGADFDRIAYLMELDDEWVWVSFDTYTNELAETGVPVLTVREEALQQVVENMTVFSNVEADRVASGTFAQGNLEFWGGDYGPANALEIPNADAAAFDFGDTMSGGGGHGCMQVHNFEMSQVVFAYNNWGSNNPEQPGGLGIGSNPNGEPDWTFSGASENYQNRNLYVLVRPGMAPNLSVPRIESAIASIGLNKISLAFNEPLAEASADLANFSIAGGLTVTAAEVRENTIVLTTETQTAGTAYTVTFNGISDLEGNTQMEGEVAEVTTPSIPALLASIPEAADYDLVYHAEIPAIGPAWGRGATYQVDEATFNAELSFDRVAYVMELDGDWVFVSFDALSTDLVATGIPTTKATDGPIQTRVANMDVASNTDLVTKGTGLTGGNIEFWASDFNGTNVLEIPNATDGFDWGDGGASSGVGYGSMQIHNHEAEEVIFAFNRWGSGGGGTDIGIGTNSAGELDYTFAESGGNFDSRNLYVLVRPGQVGDLTPTPPVVSTATASVSLDKIHLQFDQPMSASAGVVDNYTIEGLTLSGATMDPDNRGVILSTSLMTADTDYTVELSSAITEQGPGTQTVADETSVSVTAVEPLPAFLGAVPEASDMSLVYRLSIPESASFNSTAVPYSVNESVFGAVDYDRVAYALVLDDEWVFVSFDAHTTDVTNIGIPNKSVGSFQQNVTNLIVSSNVGSDRITEGAFSEGNIEFWGTNYAAANAKAIPNASNAVFDFGDQVVSDGDYGSMQVHNFEVGEVVFAYNRWGASGDAGDIGIGSQVDGDNPDWTFAQTVAGFDERDLYVFVGKGEDPNLTVRATVDSGVVESDSGLQTLSIPVRNTGSETALEISSVALNSAAGSAYTLVSSPTSIAPGEIGTIEVTVDPAQVSGLASAELVVTSNDPSQPVFTVTLSISVPISADLVAWYPLDGNMLDASGNGRHASITGEVTLEGAGLAGGTAAQFSPDPSAAYLTASSIPATQSLTISLWAQATDTFPSGVGTLFSKLNGDESPYSLAVFSVLDNTLGWSTEENAEGLSASVIDTPLSAPTHIVVVHEDTNGEEAGAAFTRLYINGTEASALENSDGFADMVGALQIGARVGENGFSGLIDDVQLYSRALTGDEVAQLFGNPGTILSGDPTTPGGDGLPVLQGVGITENGIFTLTVPEGITADVEYSTDLIQWEVIATELTGELEETDAGRIAAPSGFYRAKR